jgi:sulfonate transport system substrate-binding protein
MKQPIHRTLAVLLGILIALSFSSCRREAPPAPAKPVDAKPPHASAVSIGTFSKAYGNLPYYVARHFRWFETDPAFAGTTVRYAEFNDRPSISDAFSAGTLQILFSGDAPALLCRAQGNDIRAVAVSGNAQQEIVIPPDSAIRSVTDLRTKKVGILQATSSHYALLKILRANGLVEKDVQLAFMSPPEARVAFESGRIDAWAVWAPFVEQEQAAGKGRVLVGGDALINSVMSVSNAYRQSNAPQVNAAAAIVEKAKRWMVDHPDEAQRIAAEQLGLDPKVVSLAWPKFNWRAQLDDSLITDLQAKIDFLATSDKTRQGKSFDVRRDYVSIPPLSH